MFTSEEKGIVYSRSADCLPVMNGHERVEGGVLWRHEVQE